MWITILALVVMVVGLTLFRHYFTTPVQPKKDGDRAAAEADAARAKQRAEAPEDQPEA